MRSPENAKPASSARFSRVPAARRSKARSSYGKDGEKTNDLVAFALLKHVLTILRSRAMMNSKTTEVPNRVPQWDDMKRKLSILFAILALVFIGNPTLADDQETVIPCEDGDILCSAVPCANKDPNCVFTNLSLEYTKQYLGGNATSGKPHDFYIYNKGNHFVKDVRINLNGPSDPYKWSDNILTAEGGCKSECHAILPGSWYMAIFDGDRSQCIQQIKIQYYEIPTYDIVFINTCEKPLRLSR